MRAFSGFTTSKRSYVLCATHAVPRDIGWNSGPWTLRTGYREGYTREELDALPEGSTVVKEWIGGQVVLEVVATSA